MRTLCMWGFIKTWKVIIIKGGILLQDTKKRIHYAWVIVLGCLLMIGASIGVVFNSMSVFVKPVTEALGVSRAEFTLYSTFSSVASMIMSPRIGRLFENTGSKKFMLWGSFAVSGLVMCYSFATTVWHFYIIAACMGLVSGSISTIPVAKILSRWFNEKKGLALGISLAGSGLAASIMVPIVSRSVDLFGWQSGFRIMSAIMFLMTVPTVLFIIKESPEEMGLLPYGIKAGSAPKVPTGFTRKQALGTLSFWAFAAACVLTSFIGMGTQSHLIAYLSDLGYSSTYASSVLSSSMAVLIAGKIILGWVFDKFGVSIGGLYGCGLFGISLVLLIIAENPIVPTIFIVTFGLANAIQNVQRTFVASSLYGDLEYSSIFGLLTAMSMIGSGIGVPFSGLIYDTFGTYEPAWYGYAVLSVIIIALIRISEMSAKSARIKLGIDREKAAVES